MALGQVGNLFGLHDKGTGHQQVLYRFWLTVTSGWVNPHALEISAGTIVLAIALRKLTRQYPQFDMLAALFAAASVAAAFG